MIFWTEPEHANKHSEGQNKGPHDANHTLPMEGCGPAHAAGNGNALPVVPGTATLAMSPKELELATETAWISRPHCAAPQGNGPATGGQSRESFGVLGGLQGTNAAAWEPVCDPPPPRDPHPVAAQQKLQLPRPQLLPKFFMPKAEANADRALRAQPLTERSLAQAAAAQAAPLAPAEERPNAGVQPRVLGRIDSPGPWVTPVGHGARACPQPYCPVRRCAGDGGHGLALGSQRGAGETEG